MEPALNLNIVNTSDDELIQHMLCSQKRHATGARAIPAPRVQRDRSRSVLQRAVHHMDPFSHNSGEELCPHWSAHLSFLIQNVMFLGDLNAACSYVTNKGLKNVRLRSDPKFHWLIKDEQDTTVREKTRCAYDRSHFLSKPTQKPIGTGVLQG